MKSRNYLVVGLMSLTLIALELIWTRIFSAEFFYTFAFLVLSLAIMGLGLGALSLRLFGFLNRESNIGPMLSLSGLMALVGPPLVFKLGLNFSELASNSMMMGKFLVTIMLLGSSFYFGGIALALLFRHNHKDMPRIYMADLIGAGGGVLVAILMMNGWGTPNAAFLIALPILLAAFIQSPRFLKIIPFIIAVVAIGLCPYSKQMLDSNRPDRFPVIYRHWDAMSKIKLYEFSDGAARGINIDNVANSPVYGFDGNWNVPDSEKFEFGIPVDYLIDQFDSCVFLSLGSGGGTDVIQALQEGATEVHAVEVNPHINHMMLFGDSSGYLSQAEIDASMPPPPPPAPDSTAADSTNTEADTVEVAEVVGEDTAAEKDVPERPLITLPEFSGYLYHDPRVTVVTEDARLYVKRFKNKFDVIYSLSSNSWAALASGSFALAENYLFTTEAFEDYWQALSDSGFMMMEHQFYMPRLVSEVMEALKRQGVEDVTAHFAVYDLPQLRRNALLLSKRPLTDSLRYHALIDLTPETYEYIHLLYPAPDSLQDNLINQIVTSGWESKQDSTAFDISPCSDNRPFIAQMGMWKNFQWDALERISPYEFRGFPISKLIVVIILLTVVVLIVPLNLLPYLKKGPRLKIVPWLYFFSIGMAFMIVEVVLIQKYTLFVGPSVYSIATILLTLLVSSGIGSRFSSNLGAGAAFGGILIWLALEIFLFGYITSALDTLSLYPRILISMLMIAPLGFFMGMPFPKASLRVGELVDWGLAVNGAASVLGSTLIILIVVSYGFGLALALGAVCYLCALGLISMKSAWLFRPIYTARRD